MCNLHVLVCVVLAIDRCDCFFFAKGRKNSLEKIKQSNTIDTIRYHGAKSDSVFQHRTLSWKVRDCQTRGSSSSFDTVSLYHTVSCAGKPCLAVTYESVLILAILHHIVLRGSFPRDLSSRNELEKVSHAFYFLARNLYCWSAAVLCDSQLATRNFSNSQFTRTHS